MRQIVLQALYKGPFFLAAGSVLGLFLGKIWVCFRSVILNFRSVFLLETVLNI